MPMPSATNTTSITAVPPAIANPSAAPMNGAVQGDATTTARTPEPKASIVRLLLVHPATLDGASCPNSKTPERLSASTKKRMASAVTTDGDCSWKPQPSCSPAARSAASNNPSATNVRITPPANAMASRRKVGFVSWCVAKPSTLSERIGKTHGIRLRRTPPTTAETSAKASPSASSGAGAGARFSTGGGGSAARGDAVTVPLTATSIVAARASPPKPSAAVTTPASLPKLPWNVLATGSDST